MKQVIVMRTDLDMNIGKMIAQGAHASMKNVVLHFEDERVKAWLNEDFTKVVVYVKSEEKLLNVYEKAKNKGLIVEKIIDNGRTVFNGKKTLTCIAIGPDKEDAIDEITGKLQLMK